MKNISLYILVLMSLSLLLSCNSGTSVSEKTQITDHDFLHGFSAQLPDGTVQMVVEIPAGSNQKWEVNKQTGHLEWEQVNEDSLRVVRYQPYPANYGMIPRTYLPAQFGGDDDPLDIFLLGERVERGSVQPVRIVGVIRMLDGGEQDDKLIGLPKHEWYNGINKLEELQLHYPGKIEMLTIWLAHYKNNDSIEIQGVENEVVAREIFQEAMRHYSDK